MILILILLIIILFLIFYLRKESFQDLNIKNLDHIENSLDNFKKELNLEDKEIDLNSPILNDYLNSMASKSPDVNELTEGELPFIDNNNYTKYNHELKLLLNSKKIKQLFIINMLKNKIHYLSGSLQNIKELKADREREKEKIKCQNL